MWWDNCSVCPTTCSGHVQGLFLSYIFKLFGHQWMGKVRVLILEMAAWNVYMQFWGCNHDRTGQGSEYDEVRNLVVNG